MPDAALAVRVAVAGAGGRMGRELVRALAEPDCALRLSGAFDLPDSACVGTDAGELAGAGRLGVSVAGELHADFDVLVDFTAPEGTVRHCAHCVEHGRRIVVGTTGLDPAQRRQIEVASERIAICMSPNFSMGINVCLQLIADAARAVGEDADVEIVEFHHRDKMDAPSGTALRMGEVVAKALGRDLEDCAAFSRQGRTGPRARSTIGFSVLRGGDVPGDHTVVLALNGERVEITHRAGSRSAFVRGALRAAQWLADRPPGLYGMRDVMACARGGGTASARAPSRSQA